MSNSNNNNFYEKDQLTGYSTLEKVILAEDITFDKIENIEGKFFFKVFTPSVDTSVGIEDVDDVSNYIELIIPSSLLLQFIEVEFKTITIDDISTIVLSPKNTSFTIPKGTVFVAELIGGKLELEALTIVGVYNEL